MLRSRPLTKLIPRVHGAVRHFPRSFSSLSPIPSTFSTPDPRSVSFTARRLVNCRPEEMFAAVLAVAEYEKFLPFCLRSKILYPYSSPYNNTKSPSLSSSYPFSSPPLSYLSSLPSSPIQFDAELTIGFRIFTERYTSRVTARPHSFIRAESMNSQLFRSLNSEWNFAPALNGTSQVEFKIDFSVNSSIHAAAVKFFFTEVAERQMKAFIDRALQIKEKESGGTVTATAAAAAAGIVGANQRLGIKSTNGTATTAAPKISTQSSPAASIAAPTVSPSSSSLPHSTLLQMKFSSVELSRLTALFISNSNANRSGLMSFSEFLNACRTLGDPQFGLFPRFRSRSTLKAIADEPRLANALLERDLPDCKMTGAPNIAANTLSSSSSSSGYYLTSSAFLTEIFFLCKASPEAKFQRAMLAAARRYYLSQPQKAGSTTDSPSSLSTPFDPTSELEFTMDSISTVGPHSLPFTVLKHATIQFFQVEFDVLRQLLPGMIVRALKEKEQEANNNRLLSANGSSSSSVQLPLLSEVERGLDALALVGLIESALEESERAIEDACKQLCHHDTDHTNIIDLQDWNRHFLERNSELLSLSTVLGMSRLIGWAVQCKNAKVNTKYSSNSNSNNTGNGNSNGETVHRGFDAAQQCGWNHSTAAAVSASSSAAPKRSVNIGTAINPSNSH